MNINLKAFYVAIINNEVFCYETNLTKFVSVFIKKNPTARNYDWFYRQFKKSSYFHHNVDGKCYYFQKVV